MRIKIELIPKREIHEHRTEKNAHQIDYKKLRLDMKRVLLIKSENQAEKNV